jgi:NAD+--dinitrogen-reductase ADP-D-ribosyltransferase
MIGHSSNMVGIPTHLLATTEFNDHPVPLHIHGTCEANTGLFRMLDRSPDLARASSVFQDYMSLVFGFEEEQYRGTDALGRRRFQSSYLRLLQDWGFDSNNPQGAVLKGWVESRFGLFPTYHKVPLEGLATAAWMAYVEEKMNNRYHNNCIFLQLDLLYEFCQWAVARFRIPAEHHLALFRGADRLDELRLIDEGNGKEGVLRLNNIVSFTNRRSTASEFGRYIIETRVPVVKLLFYNELLGSHALRGEAEYLVIGGDYRVRISS